MSESAIAKLMNTRRTPVREIFIKHAEDGLIEIFSQRGSRVSLIDIDQTKEARFTREILDKAVVKKVCNSFHKDCLFDFNDNLLKSSDYVMLIRMITSIRMYTRIIGSSLPQAGGGIEKRIKNEGGIL